MIVKNLELYRKEDQEILQKRKDVVPASYTVNLESPKKFTLFLLTSAL